MMRTINTSVGMRKSPVAVIDAHAHCGVIDRSFAQSFEDYEQQAAGTDIGGVALFSPVLEIYDRHDFHFTDTPAWRLLRQKSNASLLLLKSANLTIFPYFFIWNDFAVEQVTTAHRGIKWHRHAGEPVYCYDDPKCRAALDEIRRRHLPVVLEEEKFFGKRQKVPCIVMRRSSSPISRMRGHSVFQPCAPS